MQELPVELVVAAAPSFVIVDLKVKEFKPAYAGKMNFYLSAACMVQPDNKCRCDSRFVLV